MNQFRPLVFAVLVAGAGCVDHQASLTGHNVSTLDVQLLSPTADQLGSPMAPVDVQQATFNVIARDDTGAVVAQDMTADVYISFGGVKTGIDTACGATDNGAPIQTVTLKQGVLMNQMVSLPSAFGSTSLWIEDPKSGATGASPTIYFRNATIPEVEKPADLTAANATFCSPFNGKFLTFDQPSPGGQFVVTSVFGDAFSVTDTGATSFNSIYLFAFGQPPAYIVEGAVVTSFSGNYSKFVGFTELNFPLFNVDQSAPLATVPAPVVLSYTDLSNITTMLGNDAGVVQYTGTICDPDPANPTNDATIAKTDQSWETYNQFVVDGDGTCDSFTNLAVELPAKILGNFDPTQQIGKTATFVGMLQNHSGQNPETDANGNMIACSATVSCAAGTCTNGFCYKGAYNFWTLLPRRQEDVTVSN